MNFRILYFLVFIYFSVGILRAASDQISKEIKFKTIELSKNLNIDFPIEHIESINYMAENNQYFIHTKSKDSLQKSFFTIFRIGGSENSLQDIYKKFKNNPDHKAIESECFSDHCWIIFKKNKHHRFTIISQKKDFYIFNSGKTSKDFAHKIIHMILQESVISYKGIKK